MIDAPQITENVRLFLINYAGVYRYRPRSKKFVFWFGLLGILGFLAAVSEVITEPITLSYEAIKIYSLLILGPYAAWTCLVIVAKFNEIQIDDAGIRVLPFGLHIEPQDIEKIEFGRNFEDADCINIRLKTPRRMFHFVVWSWGRKMNISFNDRLLEPVSASTR